MKQTNCTVIIAVSILFSPGVSSQHLVWLASSLVFVCIHCKTYSLCIWWTLFYFAVQKDWREKRDEFKKKVRRLVRKSQEMLWKRRIVWGSCTSAATGVTRTTVYHDVYHEIGRRICQHLHFSPVYFPFSVGRMIMLGVVSETLGYATTLELAIVLRGTEWSMSRNIFWYAVA